MASGTMRGQEAVLFSATFRQERAGDHVEEIKFEVPVRITQVQIGDASAGSSTSTTSAPVLRLFARDIYSLSSSRFASLCSSTISCSESSTSTFKTEAIITNHVILRGRYTALEFTLLGLVDQRAPEPVEQDAAAAAPPRLHECLRVPLGPSALLHHPLPAGPLAASPALVGPLPLAVLPPFMVHAVQQGLEYFRVVQRSHKRICTTPPWGRLGALHEVAEVICNALQGQPAALFSMASEKTQHPADQTDLWVLQAVDMAVSWCALLTSHLTFTQVEISVGLAGIAAALALCSNPKTCAEFMVNGGLGVLVDLLSLDRPPATIMRLSLCLCQVIVVSGAAAGCEALLGWWGPPVPKPKPIQPPPPPPPRRPP